MTHIFELRHRILLLRRKIIEEIDGTFQELWQEGDTVWAKIIPLNSQEVEREGWNNLRLSHPKYKVTIRFRRGHFTRVKWEDVTLALLAPPMIDPYRKWMTCLMYALGDHDD
jgi:head-tail adaptor